MTHPSTAGIESNVSMPARGIPISDNLHGPTRSMNGPIAKNNVLDTMKRKKINENSRSNGSAGHLVLAKTFAYLPLGNPIFIGRGAKCPQRGVEWLARRNRRASYTNGKNLA